MLLQLINKLVQEIYLITNDILQTFRVKSILTWVAFLQKVIYKNHSWIAAQCGLHAHTFWCKIEIARSFLKSIYNLFNDNINILIFLQCILSNQNCMFSYVKLNNYKYEYMKVCSRYIFGVGRYMKFGSRVESIVGSGCRCIYPLVLTSTDKYTVFNNFHNKSI